MVATPLEFSCAVPTGVDPYRKVTVPFGILLPDCAATLAVAVTFCPGLTWVAEVVSVVVVAVMALGLLGFDAMLTVTVEEAEPASAESPP